MTSNHDCMVCQKHQDIKTFTDVIAERDGWILTHFPFIADEKAAKGHLILETKRHIIDLSEMTTEEAKGMGELAQFGVQQLKTKLSAEHVYMFRINDKVAHLHVHLIPRYSNTPKEYWGFKINEWPGREILNLSQIHHVTNLLK